jgi:hypothetical protein
MITVNQLCKPLLYKHWCSWWNAIHGYDWYRKYCAKNEVIVLTAIDVDKFSSDAESLTYIGDKLAYDFNDNKIVDENGTFITSRNGFVLRRINLEIQLILIQDWREQNLEDLH